jgi:peptide/nickel transport system ATP-binding protein
MSGDFLVVRDLQVTFPTEDGLLQAVHNVSFSVDKGKTLAIVGESGSGKSVTSQAIMGLHNRKAVKIGGEIILDGQELVTASDDVLRHVRGTKMAMIFQDPLSSLHPYYTVGKQLLEARRIHVEESKAAAKVRAIDMLKRVGIPSAERRFDDYPHQLSGGMRQRVMIAMALACNPKLLIADEPTTALDVTVQAQILELMKDLRERLGMAILLITHDLGVVAEMVDEVAVMYAGRIVERGPVADVFAEPQHPYTEALLRSIPRVGMRYTEPLEAIRGMVPSPLDWPAACRFAPRCDYAFDRCRTEDPRLLPVPPQESACWLCEDGRRVSNASPVAG